MKHLLQGILTLLFTYSPFAQSANSTTLFLKTNIQGPTSKGPAYESRSTELSRLSIDSAFVLSYGPSNERKVSYAALLFKVEDNYTLIPSELPCKMELTIYKKGKNLLYNLKTETEIYADTFTLMLNEAGNGYYFVLNGIEWAEDENDAATQDENLVAKDRGSLPVGIGGELRDDELIIQNYGNALNYYVKFGTCDLKFIQFIRTNKSEK